MSFVLTPEIAEFLGLECYNEGDSFDDFPIFNLKLSKDKNQLAVLYQTYDHHNNSRVVTILEKIDGKWKEKDCEYSDRRTKYAVHLKFKRFCQDNDLSHSLINDYSPKYNEFRKMVLIRKKVLEQELAMECNKNGDNIAIRQEIMEHVGEINYKRLVTPDTSYPELVKTLLDNLEIDLKQIDREIRYDMLLQKYFPRYIAVTKADIDNLE